MNLISRLPLYCGAAMLLCAPFETLRPALEVAGQKLSNLEIVIGAALGAWVVGLLVQRRLPRVARGPLLSASALLAVMAVSALLAPAHQREALVFMGRVLAGFSLFLLFADLGWQTAWPSWVIRAALPAGFAVALLGLLEWWSATAISPLLSRFQEGPFYASALLRVSSTLQYPTISAMVLEIFFALGLAPYLKAVLERRRGRSGLMLILLLTLASAVILSRTRGGLFTLGVVLVLAAVLVWLRFPRRAACLKALLLLAVLLSGVWASTFFEGEFAWLRWKTAYSGSWFRVKYEVPESLRFQTGEVRQVPVRISNVGLGLWRSQGKNPVRLAYHWLEEETGETAVFEGRRTALPGPVGPGEKVEMAASVSAPGWPGNYCLAWDLVKEHQFWFSGEGNPAPCTRVVVTGEPRSAAATRAEVQFKGARFSIQRRELWDLALSLWKQHPWLGVGPDNFRLSYGPHAGYRVWDRSYHANNLYLEFLAGTGVAGFVALIVFFAAIARALLRRWKKAAPSSLPLLLALTVAVSAILAHGLVDYFLQFTPTYALTWAVLGLAATDVSPPEQ